jgi:hypothetical protein
MTARTLSATVAGVARAYAPWRLAHAGHLNVLSTGGIALSLAMIARGHGWSLRTGALLRCEIAGRADPGRRRRQIAWASSVNAAAIRSAGWESMARRPRGPS